MTARVNARRARDSRDSRPDPSTSKLLRFSLSLSLSLFAAFDSAFHYIYCTVMMSEQRKRGAFFFQRFVQLFRKIKDLKSLESVKQARVKISNTQ